MNADRSISRSNSRRHRRVDGAFARAQSTSGVMLLIIFALSMIEVCVFANLLNGQFYERKNEFRFRWLKMCRDNSRLEPKITTS